FLQQVFRAVDAYTRKPVVLPVSKILMEGENVQLADLLLHTRDQGRLPIDCSLAPLRDENGSIRGMVLAFRSVAERWKMQEIVGREVRQAIELQRSLLPPQGTSLPGLQMRWFFFPAALAAGDLFNLFSIDPTHVGLYMVDAPGHGIASAVNSLLLHQFLSIVPGQGTYLKLLDADALDPIQVAQKLASRLSTGGDLQSFSLVYGIIETESGSVTMVRTGLPVPLVLRAKGPVEPATAWEPERREEFPPQFTGHRFQMGAGDRLFLYSDGLVECANPDLEPFSQDRLAAQIEKVRGARLGDAVAALEDQARKWRGRTDFDDDICLMALQVG
ncbi:MAG TPA: SpoIIE family protein phosphatase, partial [Spirochaetia bacterium]|nr:SpoIIE family protein phosphatase [Spirochaetia bacterium]